MRLSNFGWNLCMETIFEMAQSELSVVVVVHFCISLA